MSLSVLRCCVWFDGLRPCHYCQTIIQVHKLKHQKIKIIFHFTEYCVRKIIMNGIVVCFYISAFVYKIRNVKNCCLLLRNYPLTLLAWSNKVYSDSLDMCNSTMFWQIERRLTQKKQSLVQQMEEEKCLSQAFLMKQFSVEICFVNSQTFFKQQHSSWNSNSVICIIYRRMKKQRYCHVNDVDNKTKVQKRQNYKREFMINQFLNETKLDNHPTYVISCV